MLGQNPTEILGALTANGQIFLLNPNGVLFGKGAQVDVGGIVASTLGMATADFMAGRYRFGTAGLATGNAEIRNQGSILANGGYIALISPTVKNEGSLIANNGRVALAGANEVTINLNGNKLLDLVVHEGAVNALVDNKGLIRADGGRAILTAKAADQIRKALVNNEGIVEATTLNEVNGVIELLAVGGETRVSGTLSAAAPNGGNGGFIETSGSQVTIADSARITTRAARGATGTWLVDPVDFTISADNAAQTASGIGASTLSTNLGSSNVSIATGASTAGNGDIFVNGAVTWATANSLTLSAHRNIDFTGGGALSGSNAASSVILNAGSSGTASSGAIIAHPGNTVITAGSLFATAASGIGSVVNPLRTQVANLALQNTNGGGIYASNTGNVTVAASSKNGDIVIRTADGADGTSAGQTGGSISVNTVGSVTGITTTGSGNVTLTAGKGGNSSNSSGGFGGTITLGAALSAAQAAALTAGNSGSSGSGAKGAGGGAITLNAKLSAGQAATLTAGHGGFGGTTSAGGDGGAIIVNTALSAGQAATLTAGNGGGASTNSLGGNAGSIILNAAISAGKTATLTAGNGGNGGSGDFNNGGGRGGLITVASPQNFAGGITFTAGSGGAAGDSATNVRSGSKGGAGGDIVLGQTLTAITAQLTAGNGGAGSNNSVGTSGEGGAGGAITVNGIATFSGDATLSAGTGGVGGSTGTPGAAGAAGLINGTQIDITAAKNLSISGAVQASSGHISLKAGMNTGNALTLSNPLLTVNNLLTDNITLQGYTASLAGSYSANRLSITTANGIGTLATPLNTTVNELALTNTVSGGIYASNTGNVTVAASSKNGDVVISAANGAAGANSNGGLGGGQFGGAGGAGGTITVSVVNGVTGLTINGSGDVTLKAGNGGAGGFGVVGGAGGAGGKGGAIVITGLQNFAGNATFAAGSGGLGGDARASGVLGSSGVAGNGGDGGGITLDQTISAANAKLKAGDGGGGGNSSSNASGAGGAGGAITVNSVATFSGDATFSAGTGGTGGSTGTPGAAGAAGLINGTQIDIAAAKSLSISGAVQPASGHISLKAGMNTGNVLTLSGPVAVNNRLTDNITLQGYTASLAGSYSANRLSVTTAEGIGASATPLTTIVNELALTNTVSGGIYASNTGNVTVAASSKNGDIVISTVNGAAGVAGVNDGKGGTTAGKGGAGGTITAGSVNGVTGLTTTGSGNITLTAGNGGTGGAGVLERSGGAGGAGGAINLAAALTTASVALNAGNGGDGGKSSGGPGGVGGSGGAINLTAALTAATAALTAGNGGAGGQTVNVAGGVGGAGGAITLGAALNASAVALTAGNGGAGGFGGSGGNGGTAGKGGAIAITSLQNFAGDLTMTAGSGGAGGASINKSDPAGNGGSGGGITLDQAIIAANAKLKAGDGGGGGNSSSNASGAGGAGGAITVNSVATFSGDATFSAGTGGTGGNTGTPGAAGVAGQIDGTQIDISAARNLSINGMLAPTLVGGNGTKVNLQANNDILVGAVNVLGSNGAALSLSAGRTIVLNGSVTTANGNLTARANDPNASAANRGAGSGDIVIGAGAQINVGSGAANLVGQRFINNSGAGALQSTGTGRWLVWTETPINDTRGGQVFDFKQYNATYSLSAPAQATGSGFLYTLAPVSIPALVGSVVKIYDGADTATLAAGNYFSTAIDGDTVILNNPVAGTYAGFNAGKHAVTVTGLSIVGATNGKAAVYGYTLGGTTASANVGVIDPRALTGADIAASSSTYGAALVPGAVTFTNIVPGDTVTSTATVNTGALSGSNNFAAGSYTQSAGAITGAQANNYTFGGFTSGKNYTINPLALTGAAISASNSIYGSALNPGTVSFGNIIAGDIVTSAAVINAGKSGSGNFVAGSHTQSTGAITGSDAANYSFTGFTTATPNYTINPLALTGAAIAASNSTYGSALNPGTVSFANVAAGDVVNSSATVNTGATSSSKNFVAGSYTQTAGTITGADSANYSFGGFTTVAKNYSIDPLALSATIANVATIYGTVAATGAVSYGNAIAGDQVNVTAGTALLVNPVNSSSGNLATGAYKQSVSSALTGADAANYSAAFTTAASNYTVAQLALTGAAIAVSNSTYGSALNPGTVSFTNVVAGDKVNSSATVDTASKSSSKNFVAGSYTQSAGAITGADAANYSFAGFTTATPNYIINQLALTGATITASNSTYGSALNPGTVSFANVLAGDAVNSSAIVNTVAKSSSNNFVAGSYTQTAGAITGADAANYSFAGFTTATPNYTINQLALTGATISASNSTYGSALNPGAVSFTNVVTGDAVNSSAAVNATTKSNSNNFVAGSYTQTAGVITGADAANYSFAGFTTATPNYTIDPLALTGTAISASNSTYSAMLNPGTVSFTNVVAGDKVNSSATVDTAGKSSSNNFVAGSYTQSAGAITGADAANYSFAGFTTATPNYTIDPLALTGATISASNSTYGSALNPGAVSFTNVVAGDTVNSSATVNTAGKSSSNNFVAGSYTQTAGAITGTDAANYSFAGFTTATPNYTIDQLALTGATIAASNSTYGSALNPGAVSFTNVVTGDAVNSSAIVDTAAKSSSNNFVAGSYTQSAGAITGTDAANYSFAGFTTATPNYTIDPLALTGATISASNSTYGSALNPGTVSFANVVAGDTVNSSATVNTAGKSSSNNFVAGSYTQTAGAITGADAANYSFVGFTTATPNYTIDPLTIPSVSGITVNNRVYDTTTAATLNTGSASFSGRIGADVLTVTNASGLFTGKHAADGKTVNISGITLGGADAGNYTLASSIATATANILPALIANVSGITANSRVYDATTGATLDTVGALFSGVLGSDRLNVGAASGAFADKNAAMDKTVNISGIALGGPDAGNYSLVSNTASAVATITPAPLSVTFGGVNKVYDGTVAATVTAKDNRYAGDVLTINRAASFADANAGLAKPIQITGIALSGADAPNYSLASSASVSTSADILARSLSIAALNANKVYGNTDPAFTFTIGGAGLAAGDTMTGVISGALARAPGESVSGGPYAITQGTLASNTNYSITAFTPAQFAITQRPLSIIADDKFKATGSPLPLLTATYSGLAALDTPASLNGVLALSTLASAFSLPGVYTINVGGQSSSNYRINYVNGLLSIGNQSLPADFAAAITSTTTTQTGNNAGSENSSNPSKLLSLENGGINLPPGVQ